MIKKKSTRSYVHASDLFSSQLIMESRDDDDFTTFIQRLPTGPQLSIGDLGSGFLALKTSPCRVLVETKSLHPGCIQMTQTNGVVPPGIQQLAVPKGHPPTDE